MLPGELVSHSAFPIPIPIALGQNISLGLLQQSLTCLPTTCPIQYFSNCSTFISYLNKVLMLHISELYIYNKNVSSAIKMRPHHYFAKKTNPI